MCRKLTVFGGIRFRTERDGVVHVFLSDADCAEQCPGVPPAAAAGPHRKLHDMSDSDSDSDSGAVASSQTRSSQSESTPRSQTASGSQPRPGPCLKRQQTDWGAALKRLRSESSAEKGLSAAASTSSSSASLASSAYRAAAERALSDEDCHLLSDEDCHLLSDDDDLVITASEVPAPPSPAEREDVWPAGGALSPADGPAESVKRPAGGGVPSAGPRAADRPGSPAALMRERAAAAAEARARGRPPPAAPAAVGGGLSAHTAPAPGRRPQTAEDACRPPPAAPAAVGGSLSAESAPAPAPGRRLPVAEGACRPESAAAPGLTPSLVLQPGSFDVVLCVDNQETSGK